MKSLVLFFAVVLSVFVANQICADDFLPKEVDVPISKIYIPQGFDTNDRSQVVIEGSMPNTCYRLGQTSTKFDAEKNQLVIEQHAYFYAGIMCMTMTVPFNKPVDLGIMKAGSFDVTDGYSGVVFGKLPVAITTSAGPDDYLYAMVDDASLGFQGGVQAVVLRGNLPGSCWYLRETKVIEEGKDVITLLPIMDYTHEDTDGCTRENTPFVTSVKVPPTVKKGRYLIQVRSLNGQSVNKLFDLN
jgi:hypothetical protein